MSSGNAKIGHPAPDFKATAVMSDGISFRGLFIVDDTGILHDLPVDCSVDETLRLVQAFQFTDKQGEVCPAGWKPGSDTIKSDVQKSKKYFSKQK
uniref:thioredoxin-dependent peroxiredoxin n=1 Tax=Macaca nemestrina TaxID=9545 RepID=A0A2K6CMD4_MACNE